MFLLTLCTHRERSSKFPSVSNSWCMRESQQYVSTYAACFTVKLLGGKQLICGPGRRNREMNMLSLRHKWQDSSITWCCISAESGWHVCNSTRSFPGIQMVKPPRQAGNTLLWRVLWPGREGVTQLLRGGQALLYMDHLNICVTLQNLQSASNLLTEHNMPQTTAIMDNWAPPNISANYMIPN